MSAGVYNITIEQGANYECLATLTDNLGARINLTGFVFRGQIRKSTSDPEIQASFTFEVLDQTNLSTRGQFYFRLSAEATSAIELPPARGASRQLTNMCYDIESDNVGNVTRWLEGLAFISPEATR